MQIIKHTIDRDGAVTLHFDGGETVQIAADKILLIAQQVGQIAANRSRETHGQYSARMVLSPASYDTGTIDERKVALILDPGSPVETVIGIDPQHALQLCSQMGEQAQALIAEERQVPGSKSRH